MGLFEFLSTPGGIQLLNAVCILLVAIAGYVSWLTHQQSVDNGRKLAEHVDQTHKMLDAMQSPPQDVVASQRPTELRQ